MNRTELDHIAFSFVHGGFDPFGEGGCSCLTCCELRNRVRALMEMIDFAKGEYNGRTD